MSPIGKQTDQVELSLVASQMSAMILSAGRDQNKSTLVRLELPIPAVDPLSWLSSQTSGPKTYWAERDQSMRIVGLGFADSFSSDELIDYDSLFTHISSRLGANAEDGKYFGGFSFHPYPNSSNGWMSFGTCRFVLPRFEVVSDDGTSKFICNLIPERDSNRLDRILSDLNKIRFGEATEPTVRLRVLRQTDNPDLAGWTRAVDLALQELDGTQLKKIVLARQSCLEFSNAIDAAHIMKRLSKKATHCFHFMFDNSESQATFMGASPELLYHRRGNRLETEALAGTRSRGIDDEDDQRLGCKLLSSEKELREHAIVVDDISATLKQLAERIDQSDLGLLKLAKVQHLVRKFSAVLKNSISDADILKALHPTSAVGGTPTKVALEKIAQLEPFDRGWYAGPVGWVGHDQALFAVAIRSGLLSGKNLCLYSGAGIVEGSHPEAEWKELNKKLLNFTESISDHEV